MHNRFPTWLWCQIFFPFFGRLTALHCSFTVSWWGLLRPNSFLCKGVEGPTMESSRAFGVIVQEFSPLCPLASNGCLVSCCLFWRPVGLTFLAMLGAKVGVKDVVILSKLRGYDFPLQRMSFLLQGSLPLPLLDFLPSLALLLVSQAWKCLHSAFKALALSLVCSTLKRTDTLMSYSRATSSSSMVSLPLA